MRRVPFETQYRITQEIEGDKTPMFRLCTAAVEPNSEACFVFRQCGPICDTLPGLRAQLIAYAKAALYPVVDHKSGKVVMSAPIRDISELADYAPTQNEWVYRVGLTQYGQYGVYQVIACGDNEQPTGLYSNSTVCSTGELDINDLLSDLSLYCDAVNKPILYLEWYL